MPYGKNNVRRRKPMARKGARVVRRGALVRKKRFSKYRVAGSSGVSRGFSAAPFPLRLFKTFTFSSGTFKLAQSVTDVPQYYQFRGNSLYDPDYTSTGTQPRYVDTYLGANGGTAPYGRYTVLASKCLVTIWQDPTLTGTNGSTAGVVSLLPSVGTTGSPPSSLKEIQERPFIKWRAVGNANSSRPLILKSFAKTKSMFTGENPLYDQAFGANYNGNPVNDWNWTVSIVNVIEGAGIGTFSCYITVQIKYYAMLTTLNDVADS